MKVGDATAQWDLIGIVRYRSRRDFLEILASPEYAKVEPNKWAALAETILIPTVDSPFDNPKRQLLLKLIILGLFGMLLEGLLTRVKHPAGV